MSPRTPSATASPPGPARRGLWGRQLDHYPANGPRAVYLGIVVLVTVTLYYELFVQGSVSTQIAADLHMSLAYLISVSVVGYSLGALASIAAGLLDRWGRANIVVYGMALSGVLVLFGLPSAHSKTTYMVMFGLVSVVEGTVLVASPALVRDFSPQLGRASAMGFWTLGPVVGSLMVTEVSSHTLDAHSDWQYQFRLCGAFGLVVFAIAFLGLRELAPRLRDQLMVSLRDQALVEARARGVDTETATAGTWRKMMRLDVLGPAFALGVFMLFFYIAVGLFVVFFTTTYGYSLARANALSNWYWGFQAIGLVITGVLSDKLKVRKPFMLVGASISAVGVALFAVAANQPGTTYYHFVSIILLISIGGAITFAAWMAAFTETIEKHSPASTAAGLAVWSAILRVIVVAALVGIVYSIPAAGTLVDQGQQVSAAVAGHDPNLTASQNSVVKAVAADPGIAVKTQALAAQYKPEVATAALLKPATSAALFLNPNNQTTQVEALSEISGRSVADVTRVLTLGTRYKAELATAAVIDRGTQLALVTTPNDQNAQLAAVGQVQAGLHVPLGTAVADLQALTKVPTADLLFMGAEGATVQAAGDKLTALSKVPPADLLYLNTYGPGLTDPAVTDSLTFLQKNAPGVQQALKDGPAQWQRWWWICFIGQLLFIPFIWPLTGRWSTAKARNDAKAHDVAVDRELAALTQAVPVPQRG